MVAVRVSLVVVFLLLCFALSMQDPQPRSFLSGDAFGPSKDRVLLFSKTNTSDTAKDQAANEDARTDERTAEKSSEEAEVEDPGKMELKEGTKQSGLEHSFATVLLKNIRDALNKRSDDREEEEEEFRANVKHRLESLTVKVQDSVSDMSTDLDMMRKNMEQKVNLMLETFSTLRLLVMGQGQHLNELRERLQGVEEQVKQLQLTTEATQKSPSECKVLTTESVDVINLRNHVQEKRNPGLEKRDTNINETIHNTTMRLENLKLQVKNITEEMSGVKDDLQDLQTNITNISGASTPTPLHTETTVTPSSISCHCSTEVLQNAVDKLEAAKTKQKSDIVELKRRISVVESFRSGMGSYSQRTGVVESPLQSLEEVKTTVAAVQDDLNRLREGMEGAVTSNVTFFANTSWKVEKKGICVWPYRRGGGSCYYVNLEDRLGWEAAREHCRGLQGDLASLTNIPPFRGFIHMQRLSRAYTYWMGASNTNPEGVWKWTDGRAVGSDVWGSEQLTTSRAPRCLAIKPAYRFGMLAESCHESKFFICQQERLL